MPKLWNDTIEAHRKAVRDATMDATAALIAHEGMSAVSMSRIAEDTGIGRATLYKYFSDVDAILLAWHERQIGRHLQQLVQVRDNASDPMAALMAVLATYCRLSAHGHDGVIAQMLRASTHSNKAHLVLNALVRDLIGEAATAGLVRSDVPPEELAAYCLGALSARAQLGGKGAADRLIDVVLSGLRDIRQAQTAFGLLMGCLADVQNLVTAKVGERVLNVRSQASRDTRPHLIGGHGDYVWPQRQVSQYSATQSGDLARGGRRRRRDPQYFPTAGHLGLRQS